MCHVTIIFFTHIWNVPRGFTSCNYSSDDNDIYTVFVYLFLYIYRVICQPCSFPLVHSTMYLFSFLYCKMLIDYFNFQIIIVPFSDFCFIFNNLKTNCWNANLDIKYIIHTYKKKLICSPVYSKNGSSYLKKQFLAP